MQFSVKKNILIDELTKANRIIDTKDEIIQNQYISIKVNLESLIIIAANKFITLKSEIKKGTNDLELRNVGLCLVKGKQILDILRKLENEVVTVSLADDNILLIVDEKSEYTLTTIDKENYFEREFYNNTKYVSVDASDFKHSLNETYFVINEYHSKHQFRGLNIHFESDTVTFSATDSVRITTKKVKVFNFNISEMDIIIPKRTIDELLKVIPESGEFKILYSNNTVIFEFDFTIIQSVLIDANYPEIYKIEENKYKTKIIFDTKKLNALLARANINLDSTKPCVAKFIFTETEINLSTNVQNQCTFKEIFKDFTYEGDKYQNIAFNAKFMFDSIKPFNSKKINIKLVNSVGVITIDSDEYPNLRYIIQPYNI